MPPKILFMAAILGVLKTGSTYVPLDVNDPVSRTRDMIHNIHPQQVITLSDMEDRLTPDPAVPVMVLEEDVHTQDEPPLDSHGENTPGGPGRVTLPLRPISSIPPVPPAFPRVFPLPTRAL